MLIVNTKKTDDGAHRSWNGREQANNGDGLKTWVYEQKT